MKLLISHINEWAAGTVTCSSEHPSFLCENTQHRWYKKVWRSKYGAGSSWGLFRVTTANQIISFDEGGGTLTATLTTGDYDTATICAEIKTQMETAGALTYTVTYSDTTKLFTIAGSGAFILKLSVTANSAFPMLGWIAAIDTASLASHAAPAIRIHTSEFLYNDAGSTETIKDIIIKNHNLQSTASVTVHFYSDAFITEVDSVNLTWHAGQIGERMAKSVRYYSVEASDPDNPDGYIEMGLIWAGDELVPHYGFTPDRSMTPEDPSIESESEDGQSSTIQLSKFKEWTYTFDAVTPVDKPYVEAVFEEIGKTRPCYILEDPPTSGDIGEDAEYVRLVGWDWPHLSGGYWGLELEVRSER